MARKGLNPSLTWPLTVLGILGTLAGLLYPLLVDLVPEDVSAVPDPVSITDYRARFVVEDDGSLTAQERLTTAFGYGRHGIFRFFDVADPTDDSARLKPEDLEVTLDGSAVPVETSWQHAHRFFVAKIGDPEELVTSVSTIPWMFFAGPAGVSKKEFYDAPEGQQTPPTVSF